MISSHRTHAVRARYGWPGAALVLLALWLQLLAPAFALGMAARAADPLRDPVICGHADGRAKQDVVRLPISAPVCGACDLCGCALPAPLVPQAPFLSRPAFWAASTWPIPPPTAPPIHERHFEARGPPSSS